MSEISRLARSKNWYKHFAENAFWRKNLSAHIRVISCAFVWSQTAQGYDYWVRVNSDFIKECTEYGFR